jgi:alkanesulfonate monooxygenase SsuD/methylene tetrahydromethanopterin reductase-like flavin-dependent oxidoreductase (luciferase family)
MEIGIGLPSTVPGVDPADLLAWARRAEQRGFASLGVLDRLVYGNDEPLVTLAAAAAVTTRVRLTTAVLVAPYRGSAAVLAKQVATLDHLSAGRVVLGLAAGVRADDFEAAGLPFAGRGARLDDMVREMREIWAGQPRGFAGAIGPQPKGGRPMLVFGGMAEAAFDRAARYGDGWIAGARPEAFAASRERVLAAWSRHGRTDAPRLMSIGYFALGPEAREQARRYLLDYYAFLGPGAEQAAEGALVGDAAVAEVVGRFEQAGCDELLLFPCSTDTAQVDLLADLVL